MLCYSGGAAPGTACSTLAQYRGHTCRAFGFLEHSGQWSRLAGSPVFRFFLGKAGMTASPALGSVGRRIPGGPCVVYCRTVTNTFRFFAFVFFFSRAWLGSLQVRHSLDPVCGHRLSHSEAPMCCPPSEDGLDVTSSLCSLVLLACLGDVRRCVN